MKTEILLLCVVSFLMSCDSKKSSFSEEVRSQFLCFTFAYCQIQRGVKYGILGDSWTGLWVGFPPIETIRSQLEKNYNYKMTGSTIAGMEMMTILETGMHIKVIDEAGQDIKYILLSLGGNDIMKYPNKYVDHFVVEKQARMNMLQSTLLSLIRSGNIYKVQKYGGAPLIWIIHGYDFSNPDILSIPDSPGCRPSLRKYGLSDSEINLLVIDTFNDFNNMLQDTTTQEPQLRYIDLRGTLGGTPFALAGYMWDCVHPNTFGFSLLTKKYVSILEGYTNYER